MSATRVIIFGTGGNCVDILDTLHDINRAQAQPSYECLGFLDDDDAKRGLSFGGCSVLGPLSAARQYADAKFVNGIGSAYNFWRKKDIIAKAGIEPERFLTIVHPTASVSKLSELGRGVVVFQNATVTTGARVGDHVIILPNTVVSHDDVIGDYTCLAGGVCVSGCVHVGASTYVGAGASIHDNVKIGERCLIGMGSVVLRDVPDNTVVVGNPARFLRNTVTG